jgi:hypothetical protein
MECRRAGSRIDTVRCTPRSAQPTQQRQRQLEALQQRVHAHALGAQMHAQGRLQFAKATERGVVDSSRPSRRLSSGSSQAGSGVARLRTRAIPIDGFISAPEIVVTPLTRRVRPIRCLRFAATQ